MAALRSLSKKYTTVVYAGPTSKILRRTAASTPALLANNSYPAIERHAKICADPRIRQMFAHDLPSAHSIASGRTYRNHDRASIG
jgi:hypothetical protein